LADDLAITQQLAGDRLLFVFPHPDDEVFSCTALWRRLRGRTPGIHIDAMWLATLPPERALWTRDDALDSYERQLGTDFAGVRARLSAGLLAGTFALRHRSREVARRAEGIFSTLKLHIARHGYSDVFCCPLEGAHPDHDVTHAVIAAAARASNGALRAHEYSSYHLGPDGCFEHNTFLDEDERVVIEISLDDDDIHLKEGLCSTYVSEPSLREFRKLPERFRTMRATPTLSAYEAPRLYYETWPSMVDRRDIAAQLAAWSAR
jgi:LmbE family N-acetylglucosaminyl deacetylase